MSIVTAGISVWIKNLGADRNIAQFAASEPTMTIYLDTFGLVKATASKKRSWRALSVKTPTPVISHGKNDFITIECRWIHGAQAQSPLAGTPLA